VRVWSSGFECGKEREGDSRQSVSCDDGASAKYFVEWAAQPCCYARCEKRISNASSTLRAFLPHTAVTCSAAEHRIFRSPASTSSLAFRLSGHSATKEFRPTCHFTLW
jgi:hypothetical protein